jgi:phosphatidylglycerol:prolipoprotein diacylglycerol transferase
MSLIVPFSSALTFPNIDPIIFEIGPFALRWYSLAYIIGLIIGWWSLARMMENKDIWGALGMPTDKQTIDDLLVWAAAGIILGGRLGYVVFYNFDYYLSNPSGILQVWQGGMSFHGGFLGVVVAMYLFAKKRKINLWQIADAVANRSVFWPDREFYQWRIIWPGQ